MNDVLAVEIGVQVATLILAITGVTTVLVIGAVLITMMHRQRKDIADGRKLARAMLDLSTQIEHEERRSRLGIKTLCDTLENLLFYWKELPIAANFNSVVKALEEPPDFPVTTSRTMVEEMITD